MQTNLARKNILIVKGSLLAERELESALRQRGATVITVTNLISAFCVLDRSRFDAAVLDKGIHNQAFDLCEELRSLGVPYLTCDAPHGLQTTPKRSTAARSVAAALEAMLSSEDHRAREGDISGQISERPGASFQSGRGMASIPPPDMQRLNSFSRSKKGEVNYVSKF